MLYVHDCEGIGCAYRDLWVHVALKFMICLRNVPDCCKMSSTSFKLGAISAGTVRCVTLEIFSLENDRGL